MSQSPYRPCQQCGTSLPVNQRFCSNCGADQGVNPTPSIDSTIPASDYPNAPRQNISGAEQYSNPPYQQPGPPPPSMPQGGQRPYPQSQPPYQQGYQQPYQQQTPPYAQVPPYAQASNNSNNSGNGIGIVGAILGFMLLRRAERRAGSWIAGCFVWIIIIAAILICVVVARASSSQQVSSSINNITDQSTPVSNIKKSSVPIKSSFTYSGVDITIVDAQQAPSFADDSDASSAGILRLDLKEQAGTLNDVGFDYTSVFQLLAPDGTTIDALTAQHDGNPDASSSRNNWIDFPIAKNIQVSQYTARIGSATEAQISIPLTGKADLSQYAAKQVTPGKQFTYGGVDFTIKDVTTELSANGPQATKGMMYVVVDLTINNNSTHTFYGDLTDVRLKTGATSTPPTNSLDNIDAGQTNVPGSLTFVMPQGSTNFSLVFLPSSDNNAPAQVSTDFQTK